MNEVWNLDPIYKGFDDPAFVQDLNTLKEKVAAFAERNGLSIVAEIPRSDDIIRYEDMGKTVVEGDRTLEVSGRFLELAARLWAEEI